MKFRNDCDLVHRPEWNFRQRCSSWNAEHSPTRVSPCFGKPVGTAGTWQQRSLHLWRQHRVWSPCLDCDHVARTPRKHVAHRREGIRPCIGERWPRSLLVSDRRPLKSRSRRRDLNAAFMGGALCLQKWSKPCLLQCVERAVGSGFESIQHISGVKLFTARAIMCRKSLALRPPQFH